MKPTAQIRPVSYLKAHAAELIRQVQEVREPVIVTQNGEAKAVLHVLDLYEGNPQPTDEFRYVTGNVIPSDLPCCHERRLSGNELYAQV